MTESYVVGMPWTRGALNIPGVYKAENGKLIAVKQKGGGNYYGR